MSTGFQTLSKIQERFKGGFLLSGTATQSKKFNPGEYGWAQRCKHYDDLYKSHSLAKSCIRTLAGQVMAEGLFLIPAVDDEGKPYARTLDATEKCNKLNRDIGLDILLHESTMKLAKYGSVFWEVTYDPIFDVQLAPQQELIEPYTYDENGNITRWRQGGYGNTVSWTAEELIHIPCDVTPWSWPYGTSLYVGLESDFEILDQLKTDIKEFMHKNAFPKEMFQIGDGNFVPSGDDITAIKSKARNWEPGEYLVTSYPIEHKSGGTGDREVRNLNDVLAFIKQDQVDGMMTPPVSFQYSSTYASSKEMMLQQRANLVIPLQRIFKRTLETRIYKPFLESDGFSVLDTPAVTFENPEAHKSDVIDYYSKGVASKIFPPRWAARQLGVPLPEFDAWVKEEDEKQQKMFDQKMEQTKQQFDQKQEQAQSQQATGDKTPKNQKKPEVKPE